MEDTAQVNLFNPVNWIVILLNLLLMVVAVPLRGVAWSITTIRARLYDPEEATCPSCGFRGNRGTGHKTCRIRFTRTEGPEKCALEHICFRCGANFYTKIFSPADKWLSPLAIAQVEKIKKVAQRTAL